MIVAGRGFGEAEVEIGTGIESVGGPWVYLEYRPSYCLRQRWWTRLVPLVCVQSWMVRSSNARDDGIGPWRCGILLVGGMDWRSTQRDISWQSERDAGRRQDCTQTARRSRQMTQPGWR